MKHYQRLPIIVVAGLLTACSATKSAVDSDRGSAIPARFSAEADTAQDSGRLRWNEFFDDPYLLTLIDTALARNLDLKIAMQRIDMARANVRLARGALLPSLTAVTTAGRRKFGEYTMDGIGNFDTNFSENVGEGKHIPEHLPDYYLGVQSGWEIDLWGKLRSQRKASLARFLATEKGRHLITTTLVSSVARAYYELLTLDNEQEIIRENIKLQESAVELVNAQKLAGRANLLAVKQIVAQLLNTKSLEASVRQEIIKEENQLNLLLGRFPQPIKRGSPILKQGLPREIYAGIPSRMLIRRPDIQQAELELMAGKSDVIAARAAFFPSLTLTSAIGYQAFNTKMLFNPGSLAYSIFGGLSGPLFNRNLIKANYQQATARQKESLYRYQQSILLGFQEAVTGLARIGNLQEMSNLKEEEVGALQEGVAASKDLFIAGMASYLEVVSAQKNVLEAELGLSLTRKEQFFAMIDVYRALGGGWE